MPSPTVPGWLIRFVLPDGRSVDKFLEIQSIRIGPQKQQRWAKVPDALVSFVSASVVQRATTGTGRLAIYHDELTPVERMQRAELRGGTFGVYVRPADVMR